MPHIDDSKVKIYTHGLNMLACFNPIVKRNGLVHIFDAVPVHQMLCEYMKRSLAIVKLWIIEIV